MTFAADRREAAARPFFQRFGLALNVIVRLATVRPDSWS
jgi:hypothetical protein